MGGVRILISTWPAHGHLLPLLPIARAAERAGHDVVVASGVEGTAEAGRRSLGPGRSARAGIEANAAFGAVIGDLSAVAPERRMATLIEGVFGAAAFRAPRRWCRSSRSGGPTSSSIRSPSWQGPWPPSGAVPAMPCTGSARCLGRRGTGSAPASPICAPRGTSPIWRPASSNGRTSTTVRLPSSPMRWPPSGTGAGSRHARRGRARRAPPMVE